MRYFLAGFFTAAAIFTLCSVEVVKFDEARRIIKASSFEEMDLAVEQIKNKKVEKETGWVYSIKSLNDALDIVYVEMDNPQKDFSKNKPDLYFYIDKKYTKRLREYQIIYFNGIISGYDYTQGLFELKDIFLSGLMK